jgi:hypothetical protein
MNDIAGGGVTGIEGGLRTGFTTRLESRWRINAATFARMGGEMANDNVTSCFGSTSRSDNPGAEL